MKSLKRIVRIFCFAALIGRPEPARGFNSPIDSSSSETVTDRLDFGSAVIEVGVTTHGNGLIITNGGGVVSGGGLIGNRSPASHSNRVVVAGSGSSWISSGDISLNSSYNRMEITGGGRVESVRGRIGGDFHKDNNLVLVSGSGSVWSNSGLLQISGAISSHNAVIVTNGGRLYSGGGTAGDQGNAHSRIVITGSGSSWKNSADLYAGWGSQLQISDGGTVENSDAVLIANSAVMPSEVSGPGSVWHNSGTLRIQNARLAVSNGGSVESGNSLVFSSAGSDPSTGVTVSGTGSVWRAGDLNCTGAGLTIADGGSLETSSGYGESAQVTITGGGSAWKNTGDLYFRTNSSSVVISDRGTLETESINLEVTNSVVHLQTGGKLIVSGDFNAIQTGSFDFQGGTLSVGGTLTNLFLLAAGCRLEAINLANDLSVEGTFAPGQSPADATLDGQLILGGAGRIEMELTATEHDQLTVTGRALLDGTLALLLQEGFSPEYGASFDLFDWEGGTDGTFAVTNLPVLADGLHWDTGDLYNGGTVSVVPEPATALLMGIGGIGTWLLRRNRLCNRTERS